MKKAFTLIELLVVIAIIAILAAILFPVFAQAKLSAKKAASISNQKQISIGIMMYAETFDDTYPRNDDCIPNSSLNSALNGNPFNPVGPGCTSSPFYYRVNHFAWQKWIMPYVKNVDIFKITTRQIDQNQWNTNGQIVNSYLLNTGFTGQLDTYNRPPTFQRQYRNSWTGGMQTAIPSPAEAALLLEGLMGSAIVPPGCVDGPSPNISVECYTMAVREFWRYKLMKGSVADCVANLSGTEPDPLKTSQGGLVIGFADGHAKFMPAAAFLAKTPTQAEYGISYTFGNNCSVPAGNMGITQPNTSINYPMWGLGG